MKIALRLLALTTLLVTVLGPSCNKQPAPEISEPSVTALGADLGAAPEVTTQDALDEPCSEADHLHGVLVAPREVLEGATWTATYSPGGRDVIVEADGRFDMGPVNEGRGVLNVFKGASRTRTLWATTRVTIDGGSERFVRIELPAEGRVVVETEPEIDELRMSYAPLVFDGFVSAMVHVQPGAAFLLPAREYDVVFKARGYRYAFHRLDVQAGEQTLRLALEREVDRKALLLDELGNPLRGRFTVAEVGDVALCSLSTWPTLSADEEGVADLSSLPDGSYTLAFVESNGLVARSLELAGFEDELVLPRTKFSNELFNAENGSVETMTVEVGLEDGDPSPR